MNKNNLSSKIWDICNLFRGSIDASKFKDYILVLFFVWYLSEQNKKKDTKNKFSGILEKKEIITLKHLDIFGYLFEKKNEINFGEIINKEFTEISNNNKKWLFGIFDDINEKLTSDKDKFLNLLKEIEIKHE